MSDIHALSGAYAVDALDDIERAQFERHLAECDSCRSEVDSLREASALLAETAVVAPSDALRSAVLAEIATVRPLPPVARPISAPAPGRRRRFPALVAAAAAVIAVGTGVVVAQPWQDESSQAPSLTAADKVRLAPDAQKFENTFGGLKATFYRSESLHSVAVFPHGGAALPDDKTLALWLQHDNRMVAAGFLNHLDEPTILAGDAADATGAAISVEDAGVAPSNPSDDVVALVDFEA